ncbi:cytochrome-c peroxidase [Desulfosediminicola sp.]|uniref:cytochrome-c peroxidase n=1 Tax=Desulfosediminicola sp. TaxID=2886825 RepID=UPI003AF2BFFB
MEMTNKRKGITLFTICSFFIGLGAGAANAQTPMEELGEFLYFDENLSEPAGQSCASCHLPRTGFDEPDEEFPVSEGVIPGEFGGRNSPISAYAMYSPIFHYDGELYVGGAFWDGRATGEVLGDPLADQALGPFLNPVEMANPSKQHVIDDIKVSEYAALFEQVWGPGSLDDTEAAYDQVALSIAAFERTVIFGQFTSKYDYYLEQCLEALAPVNDEIRAACATGSTPDALAIAEGIFTQNELRGFILFMGENNNDGFLDPGEGAMCSACHIAEWTQPTDDSNKVVVPDWADGFIPPLFSDFTYDNLGVPKSKNRLLAKNPPDLGLGVVTTDPDDYGKFKVMPLRGLKESGPYAHNGFFDELDEIVNFYNTRDVGTWKDPEYPATINTSELGNLGLSPDDEGALVQFMKTLSDGFFTPE